MLLAILRLGGALAYPEVGQGWEQVQRLTEGAWRFCGASLAPAATGSFPPDSLAERWQRLATKLPKTALDMTAAGNAPIPACSSALGGVLSMNHLEENVADIVQRGLPALFRGLDEKWDHDSLQPTRLLQDHAAVDVLVAGIPYAETFGGQRHWARMQEFEQYMAVSRLSFHSDKWERTLVPCFSHLPSCPLLL